MAKRNETAGVAVAAPARKRVHVAEAANGQEKVLSGTAAAVKVLRRRKNKEMTAGALLTACLEAGWKPEGKTPKQTLVAALQNEMKRKGDKARFAKGDAAGTWKLSPAGMQS